MGKKNFSLWTVGLLGLFFVQSLTARAASTTLRLLPVCGVILDSVQGERIQLHAYRNDTLVGALRYTPNTHHTTHVDGVFVGSSFKHQGISTELFAAMLAREPDTERVTGYLIIDNYDASGLKYIQRKITEAECALAVTRTPFYKSLCKFGFCKVVGCKRSPFVGSLTVSLARGVF